MKFLDLDKFTPATGRFLRVAGQDHAINAIGVGAFIDTNLFLKGMDQNDAAQQLQFTVDTILKLVPTLGHDQLNSYTLEQLNKIADFVRGEDVQGAQEVAEGETGK